MKNDLVLYLRNPCCHILLFILGGKMNFNFNSRGVNLQLLFSAEVYSSYTTKEKKYFFFL